ncbi:MAG TPA: aldolase/citrate lyase family protein [Sphingomicrobium sp.]
MSGTLVRKQGARPISALEALLPSIDFTRFASLKGEFEAEGLTAIELAGEVIWAARHGLDYLVKIGGCEAKSDIDYLQRLGVRSVVAPMIESGFAMSKYMGMLPNGAFDHVGVTIETVHAVDRIEEILDAGTKLTAVTIGRSDLTASFGGSGTNCPETLEKTLRVATAARARGLEVTMGGSVDTRTRELMREGHPLSEVIDAVETRKVVMPIATFIEDGTLEDSITVESALLDIRMQPLRVSLDAMQDRFEKIRSRI